MKSEKQIRVYLLERKKIFDNEHIGKE